MSSALWTLLGTILWANLLHRQKMYTIRMYFGPDYCYWPIGKSFDTSESLALRLFHASAKAGTEEICLGKGSLFLGNGSKPLKPLLGSASLTHERKRDFSSERRTRCGMTIQSHTSVMVIHSKGAEMSMHQTSAQSSESVLSTQRSASHTCARRAARHAGRGQG